MKKLKIHLSKKSHRERLSQYIYQEVATQRGLANTFIKKLSPERLTNTFIKNLSPERLTKTRILQLVKVK